MSVSVTELKNHLSEAMDEAQGEPVVVSKNGRPYAVLMGHAEYLRLQALEDAHWADRARAAIASADYIDGADVIRDMGLTRDIAGGLK